MNWETIGSFLALIIGIAMLVALKPTSDALDRKYFNHEFAQHSQNYERFRQ